MKGKTVNRFLLTTSAFAVVLSVALASFSLLGFVISDLPTVFLALALFTIASMFACIIIFAVLAEILLCILVFVLKTSGRKNDRLRLTARRIILSLYDPSDFF